MPKAIKVTITVVLRENSAREEVSVNRFIDDATDRLMILFDKDYDTTKGKVLQPYGPDEVMIADVEVIDYV